MVSIRFSSLVLGLLFVMHILRDSSAHAHQGINRNGPVLIGKKVVSVEKELLDGISGAAMRKARLGGRRTLVDKVLRKEIEKEEGLIKGGASETSGNNSNNGSKKFIRFQGQLNDQNKINMLKPRILNSASLGISRSEPVLPNSKTMPTTSSLESSSRFDKSASQEPHDTAQKDETKRLLEAAEEIVSLMHKDYRANDKPRRKPPINNHEPWH